LEQAVEYLFPYQEVTVSKTIVVASSILLGAALAATWQPQEVSAQSSRNPYRPVEGLQAGEGPARLGRPWAKLPDGRHMGSPAGMEVDLDGEHVWVAIRCGGEGDPGAAPLGDQTSCGTSDLDPIVRFAPDGTVSRSFGSGMFVWPHGMHVDRDGNVWVTEAATGDRLEEARLHRGRPIGHQVFKFSPTGQLLMTLGEAGVAGNDEYRFNAPSDVVTAPNGDIFVVDGHGTNDNNRIVKYSRDGTFIKAFGETGYGPGQMRGPHAIAMDPTTGRLFVADRRNQRVLIFDQDGTYLSRWTQFGMPSDIAITADGRIYVADSESDLDENAGWEKGIRVGDVAEGWVDYFIQDYGDNPPITAHGSGPESIAVDRNGNIYAGEPRPQTIRKWVKIR